jgi:hypothetical protein
MRSPGWILGFHGCDREVAEKVLAGKAEVRASENQYDWDHEHAADCGADGGGGVLVHAGVAAEWMAALDPGRDRAGLWSPVGGGAGSIFSAGPHPDLGGFAVGNGRGGEWGFGGEWGGDAGAERRGKGSRRMNAELGTSNAEH